MKVSVGIPATRAETLGHAIASVIGQTYVDWELIVVVQGPDPAVVAAARQSGGPRCRVVSIPRRGASRARNAALRESRGEIIAMIDDDCEAAPDWLAVLVSCFEEDPEVGLVGGALLAPAGRRGAFVRCPSLTPADATYDASNHNDGVPRGWDWIGANFAIRRWVMDRVGDFDECLGPGADFGVGEDTDYKLRLEEQGIRMRSTPRAVVHHTFGARSGLSAMLRMQRGYATGNGGLAGKLSLRGDPRGREWLDLTRQQCAASLRSPAAAYRAPESLVRWAHYRSAYSRCMRDYELDDRGLLRLRQQAPVEPLAVSSDR